MSALPGSGTGTPQSFCGFCGFTDTQPFTYCPRCGRPASTSGVLASNISQQLIPSAPTVPGVSETVGESPATLPPARARWNRRKRLTVIGGGVLAFLIVASAAAYFVYSAFFAFNQTDSARYLPSNTIFYTSLDLQQISQNSHQVSLNDVAGTINSGLEQSTGLSFQNDVQPWLGRGFTYALVSISQQAVG